MKNLFLQRVDANRAAGMERAAAFTQAREDDPDGYRNYMTKHNQRYGYQNRDVRSPEFRRRAGGI